MSASERMMLEELMKLTAAEERERLELEERERLELAAVRETEKRYETAFQEALKNGNSKLKRARVMTVGDSRVGKTSLLKRLIGERFDPEQSSTIGVEQDKICTSDVSQWRIKEKWDILSSPTDELARATRSMASTSTEESTLFFGEGALQISLKDHRHSVMKQQVLRMAQTGSQEKGMTYHLWDFGGQYVYHITHPIFLTWRAIYILVINLEKDQSTNMQQVHFWLKSIYTHAVDPRSLQSDHTHIAREPKILLVGTHADAVRDEVEEKMKSILENLKRTHYHLQISNYFDVDNSNMNDPKIKKVRKTIDKLMGKAPFMKESVPTRWVLFEDRIHELTAKKKFYIKHSKALEELTQLGIKDDEAEAALRMFHDFGKIVYYNDIDLVVLDPQWLNGIMTKIIAVVDEKQRKDAPDEWKKLEEQGVLTKKLINIVWKKCKKQKEALLSIMEKFDLICKIVVESTTDSPETSPKQKKGKGVKRKRPDSSSGEDCYFVPCRVEKGLRDQEKKKSHGKFTFLIDFHGFVPVGFVHRLFVRIARWTMARGSHMPRFHKEEMTFFVDLRHQLVMKVVDGDEIQVSMMTVISKPSPTPDPQVMREFLDMLEENLEDLKEKWARRIKFTIGLKCTNCIKYDDTVTVPLRKFLKDDLAVCYKCDERLDSTPAQEAFGIKKSEDTSTSVPSTSGDGPVDDDKLEILAKRVPHGDYTMFCSKLGIPYNEARVILAQFKEDYRGAIRECLAKWKNKTGGMLSNLKKILIEIDLKDLTANVE